MRLDQGQAGALKEPFFERQKDALDQIAHLVEQCDNRFSFKSPRLSERYLEGRLTVILKLRNRRSGEELALFVHGDRVGLGDITSDDKVLSIAIADDQWFAEKDLQPGHPRALDRVRSFKAGVLVASVKIVDGPQKIVSPCVWLERADHVYGRGGQVFCFPFDLGFEDILVFPEREVGSVISSSVLLGDGASHVVEGASQVVDDLAGHDGQSVRVGVRELKTPDAFGAIEIEIADNLIAVRANESAHRLVEIVDLGFGPVDLGLDYRERVRAYVQ